MHGELTNMVLNACLIIGAFGEVRICVHRESGAQRAVKVLRKNDMDDTERRMLINEINILKAIVSNLSNAEYPTIISIKLIRTLPCVFDRTTQTL